MEPLKSTEEAGAHVHLKAQTLRNYRSKGGGPDFIKLAPNRVAYRTSDLERWIESRRRTSTCDPSPGRAA